MTAATATKPQTQQFAPKQELNLWKPTKDGNGAAALFSFSDKHNCFWLKMMPQSASGEDSRSFDNAKAINIKLGISDIGQLLAVLTGKIEGIGKKNEKNFWSGIYHENDKGSSSISLSHGQYGLHLSASQKNNDQAQATRYSVGVTVGEAEVLRVFFESKLPQMLFSKE